MNILITAATIFELKPFLAKIPVDFSGKNPIENIQIHNFSIDILISGIGMVHTSYHLTKALKRKNYDLVINTGIAGSFNPHLQIGEVVIVEQEVFGDLGIENSYNFESLFESGFLNKDEFPFNDGKMICDLPEIIKTNPIRKVKGLTSNTAHGNQVNIYKLINKFEADIETMEGAAFFYVCLMEKVDFIQIRSISNYVENRDTSKWNIPLALENLSNTFIQLIGQINSRFS